MSFWDNLEKKLIDNNLSEGSIKLYLRNMKKLNDKNVNNLNFLKDTENILKKLEGKKENTKRNYLIAICKILNITNENNTKNKKIYDFYYNEMMNLNKKLKSEESKNEKSETQKKNWIEWVEVEKRLNELKDQSLGNKKNFDIKNASDYYKMLKYVILSLYVYIPPRRNKDYLRMLVFKKGEKQEDNYNYYDPVKKEFIFNDYKTSKKTGQQVVKVPVELCDILNKYVKSRDTNEKNYLLTNYDGIPLEKKVNSITYVLNEIFNKKISSSMLRHVYLSSKYKNVSEDMKNDAQAMGHSEQMQKEYIKK